MPNYTVKMGFGLHLGWAIEGAIGSDYKIDASYLSPDVKISDHLELLTKVYGVMLLFSKELYDNLTVEVQGLSRELDAIKLHGRQEIM